MTPKTFPLRPIFLISCLMALPSCGDSGPVDGPVPQRVLLISLDTLRADHTGFGGYSKPTTPFLDSLADRGIVFDNHFANSNCTLPSHATMLTGLHYQSHGVKPVGPEDDIRVLPQSITTLAERFQENGYATAGFASHGTWLTKEYGFDQGFDVFKSSWDDADTVIGRYLDYLDDTPAQQSFAFLHFFDIHSDNSPKGPCFPYQSDGDLIREFAGTPPEDFTGCSTTPGREKNCASNYLKDLSTKIEPLPEDHLEFIVGLYDAGIRKMDDKLKEFFGELDRRGQLENTLIVITSDHGESFYEHGTMLHDTHHDEVARVPLIILLPETSGVAPRRIDALTQSTDLAATILDLVGLEPIGQLPSLAGQIMEAKPIDDGFILFHAHVGIGRDEEGEYKYLKIGGRKPPHFYDRGADPEELHNRLEDAEYKEQNRDRLLAVYKKMNEMSRSNQSRYKAIMANESGETSKLNAEQLEELRRLGYIDGGQDVGDAEEEAEEEAEE